MKTLIALGVACGLLTACSRAMDAPDMPSGCPKDRMLVGYGTFEDGLWSSYRCGPSEDDLLTFAQRKFLEQMATCPEADRDPSGYIATFYTGSDTVYVRIHSKLVPVAYFLGLLGSDSLED